MARVFARLWWDVRHLFDSERFNPYVVNGEGGFTGANRTGLEDITHALKNVLVESWRHIKARFER